MNPQLLSQSLLTSLQRDNGERLIQDCLNWHYALMQKRKGKEGFVHLFRHDNFALTLDQIRNVETLLSTNWLKEDVHSIDYKYCKKDTLFNAVLRFSENALTLIDDKPACRYDQVLAWHELSMQLGEDLFTAALTAAYDVKHGRVRDKFLWRPYITTVHPALDELYQQPLTELHAHLKGTSMNFDLNWMSLMNHIQNRAKEFEQFGTRQHAQVTVEMYDHVTDLYHQVMKAAAIRLYLFAVTNSHGDDVSEMVMEMLRSKDRLEGTYHCAAIQESIDCYRQLYGKRYERADSGLDIVDYAISSRCINSQNDLLVSVLSGERELLYNVLKLCYEGRLTRTQEQLLTAYLVIKTRLRQEMVQLNEGVGFANFATYENRKTAFIKEGTVYERLVAQLAIGNFLKEQPENRYMEARIVPKENADAVRKQISQTDSDVKNSQFGGAKGWQYYYIYHFIKAKDKTKNHLKEFVPRHHALREKVKRQAKAIYGYRNYNLIEGNDRMVAIDAANSEILTRPEVFAQAYRYLRRHAISDDVVNRPNDIRMTYHVGEDFLDVVDGLRAYDEVIKFLQLGEGDRLGHALVLGVDVPTYYKRRNHVIAMPVQTILDNVVWLYEESKNLGDPYVLTPQLEREYENYYRKLFGSGMLIYSIHSYYHSWLLRGDNPFCYQDPMEELLPAVSVDEWEMNNLVVGDEEIANARKDAEARMLYSLYHFNRNVKDSGEKVEEYHVSDAFVKTIELLREKKLQDAERRHLAIECNPTSNYKIGELTDFAEHPITRFYNDGIYTGDERHSMSVSINTDDAGVFVTSIEREYAVMAKALEDKYNKNLSPKQIYDWLDDVRMFGLQQKFVKA